MTSSTPNNTIKDPKKGVIATNDKREAEKLAQKGHNVQLTKEEEEESQFNISQTTELGVVVGNSLLGVLRSFGEGVANGTLRKVQKGSFSVNVFFENDKTTLYNFYIDSEKNKLNISLEGENFPVAEVGKTPSGGILVHEEALTSELQKVFKKFYMTESTQEVTKEETEYKKFFKAELEKTGKSVGDMSDEEKTKFFNLIDKKFKAKDESSRAVVDKNGTRIRVGNKLKVSEDATILVKEANGTVFLELCKSGKSYKVTSENKYFSKLLSAGSILKEESDEDLEKKYEKEIRDYEEKKANSYTKIKDDDEASNMK